VIVIVVIVAILLVTAVLIFYAEQAPTVQVTGFNVWSPDNACGLATNPISYGGFNDSTGASDEFSFQLPNYNTTPCTVVQVSTNTSGFSVSDTNVPVTVPGSGNGTLNLTLSLPNSGFDGIVNLVYT